MATTRGQVRATIDLVAKRKLQKLDGSDIIFEASGSLASGKVTVSVPLSASTVVVTGSGGFIISNGGATISGSTITSGSLIVGGNSNLSVTGGEISGSSHLKAGGDLTVAGSTLLKGNLDVEGNMIVRGMPTIINTDVLEVKDNIVVINKVSGSESAYDAATGGLYVNRGNFETASLLWVSSSNDWQLAYTTANGVTSNSADLVVNKLKPLLISGSSGVSVNSTLTIAATASLHTSASFVANIPTSSVTVEGVGYKVFNLDTAFHALDTKLDSVSGTLNAVSSSTGHTTAVQEAYRRLRYQASGNFDANGFAEIALPAQVSSFDAFPVSSFNFVTADVMIKVDGRWINDLVALEMVVSGTANNAIHVLIDAPALGSSDEYRLIAINNDPDKFVI